MEVNNMKKMLFALIAVVLFSSLCFAEQPTAPAKDAPKPAAPASESTPKPVGFQILTGKMDSITIGDAVKGENSEIAVIDEKGQKMNFIATASLILAKDRKILTLSDLKKDDKVVVKYTTTEEGANIAHFIDLE
jgi:hypothetical protein